MNQESVENRPIIDKIRNLSVGKTLRLNCVSFEDLYNIKYPVECEEDPSYMFFWNTIKIHAKRKTKRYRVWMVSRFGDIGITPNSKNPNGYDERTEDIDKFYDWEFTKEIEFKK